MELQKQGEILDIELQPRFTLQDSFTKNGLKYRKIEYIADFKVTYSSDDGIVKIIDVKGQCTSDFKIKAKIWNKKFMNETLEVIGWSKIDGGWCTVEKINSGRRQRKKDKKGSHYLNPFTVRV